MLIYQDIIRKMTLEEKASLLSGENFWNTKSLGRLDIPSIMLTDGPHGLRKQGGNADHLGLNKSIPATCFPTAATLANSWDVNLLRRMGEALARECVKEDVSVILGPGMNIKRNPLCGRNFEYFSEDPYLTGKLASGMIQGIESKGISACPKHFAVNSQEHLRMTIDELVDERALRELYLEGFRYAITEGKPGTIMTSYNKVNGAFANENQNLLNEILIKEWGFNGVVVTDWGGNNDRVQGLIAGNHLEMPSTGGITDQEVIKAVRENIIEERLLDERVDTLLQLMLKRKPCEIDRGHESLIPLDFDEQHEIAISIAKQSMVLLKNNEVVLPLNTAQKIAVIGDFAKKPRYQGAGSSLIEPTRVDSALEAMMKRTTNIIGYAEGFNRLGGKNQKKLTRAIQLSKKAEIVVVFLGLDEGSEAEGIDRNNMSLRNEQLILILELLKVQEQFGFKIVIVLSGGSPIELPFEPDVQGILHSYLGGQGSGEATAALLFGEDNPCGKLAETYPLFYDDVPSSGFYPGKEKTSEHREGLYFGYRYYDKAKVRVRYPFGYGLSYTTFQYSDLNIEKNKVSFKVTNIGKMAGAETVQLYIGKPQESVYRCVKELKGFDKQFIEPGDSHIFTLTFDSHAFEYYDVFEKDWKIEAGEYEIAIGASSEDIRLRNLIKILPKGNETTTEVVDFWRVKLPSELIQHSDMKSNPILSPYYSGHVKMVSSHAFEKLCMTKLPESLWDRGSNLGFNDTIGQGQYKSWVGKALSGTFILARKALWQLGHPILSNNVYFLINMPFRQIERFTKGKFSKTKVQKLLNVINHGLIKGAFYKEDL